MNELFGSLGKHYAHVPIETVSPLVSPLVSDVYGAGYLPLSPSFFRSYIIPETLDPLQFAYRPNRSTDIAISIALYTALSLQNRRNTYVRRLFIDYSSAFNTMVPFKAHH
jgi:hypothetical protein